MLIAFAIMGTIAVVGLLWLWVASRKRDARWLETLKEERVHETRKVEQPVPALALCWASKRSTLAVVGDGAMQAFLEKRKAEEKLCELPALLNQDAQALVERLRAGESVLVDEFLKLPKDWRATVDGGALQNPLHWSRIDGKRIELNRAKGELTLFAEDWM